MVAFAVASGSSLIDRVYQFLEKADCRRADTDIEREAVFRLRYEAYLREGAIQPAAERRLADGYDDADNALIFGIYVDGELTSSIRLTVASDEYPELPALQVFSDVLLPQLEQGKIIVDPTRFVVDRRLGRRYPELPYATVRLAWAATEYFEADLLLATVRAEHQAFYRRVFGHRVICDCRPYPNLKKPISLMVVEYPSERDRVLQRYPFFRSTALERQNLFERHPAVAPRRVAA
jgi:hypothetical protein